MAACMMAYPFSKCFSVSPPLRRWEVIPRLLAALVKAIFSAQTSLRVRSHRLLAQNGQSSTTANPGRSVRGGLAACMRTFRLHGVFAYRDSPLAPWTVYQTMRCGHKRTIKVQYVCEVDASLPPCLLKGVHDLGLLAVGDLRATVWSQ